MERIFSSNDRFFAEVYLDDCPENPREMYDHDTTIVYSSSRYILGDENIPPDDFVMPDNVYAFPVYAYIHSGIALSLSRSVTDLDPQGWDNGQSGWMYIGKDKVESEEAAYCLCTAELEEFEAYLNGDVWGYSIYEGSEDADPGDCRELESCGGYYGWRNVEEFVRGELAGYEEVK